MNKEFKPDKLADEDDRLVLIVMDRCFPGHGSLLVTCATFADKMQKVSNTSTAIEICPEKML